MGLPITTQQQARIFAIAMLAILTLGTIALIAACIAACWLLIQCCALLLQSSVEALNAIASTYEGADPLIRLIVLALLGYALYRLVARFLASRRARA